MYTQQIHQGESYDFPSFLGFFENEQSLDYCSFIDNYAYFFGKDNVYVRSYHAASKYGLINDFGRAIRSRTLRGLKMDARVNSSYSQEAIDIARRLNTKLDDAQKRYLRLVLQRRLAKTPNQSFGFLDDMQRQQVISIYQERNRELAGRYFDGNLEDLFPKFTPTSQTNQRNGQNMMLDTAIVADIINDIMPSIKLKK